MKVRKLGSLLVFTICFPLAIYAQEPTGFVVCDLDSPIAGTTDRDDDVHKAGLFLMNMGDYRKIGLFLKYDYNEPGVDTASLDALVNIQSTLLCSEGEAARKGEHLFDLSCIESEDFKNAILSRCPNFADDSLELLSRLRQEIRDYEDLLHGEAMFETN